MHIFLKHTKQTTSLTPFISELCYVLVDGAVCFSINNELVLLRFKFMTFFQENVNFKQIILWEWEIQDSLLYCSVCMVWLWTMNERIMREKAGARRVFFIIIAVFFNKNNNYTYFSQPTITICIKSIGKLRYVLWVSFLFKLHYR